jgi:hypothetical protein
VHTVIYSLALSDKDSSVLIAPLGPCWEPAAAKVRDDDITGLESHRPVTFSLTRSTPTLLTAGE